MANNNHSIITIGTVVPGQDTGRGWRRHQPRLSMSGLSLNPTSQLVIGIDFGTTFTGVAFAHSSIGIENARSNSASQSELDAVIEKITVIKSWPNPNRQYDEKTPSIIAYKDGRPVAWGGLMNRTHKTRVHCFKLGLQEGVGQHYQNSNASSLLGGFLNDCNWRHPDLPSKTAVDYCADYLTLVGEYVMNKVLPDHFGEEFLRNQQISFAITVPAIWSDKAKDATREAAERAGIPNRRLTLITEPEAAAQYCATICNEAGLTTGNHFLICDAGGGTVDLVAYKIESLSPFAVKESSVGTGAACGAMYLNAGFASLMNSKLERFADEILDERRVAEAQRCFESTIKCNFNPLASYCEDQYEIPLPGARDIPLIGLEGGFLTLSKHEIDSIFTPIFKKIHRLVVQQCDAVRENYRAIVEVLFMVGGFGANEYLAQYLTGKISRETKLKKPAFGWTAITRGAVLHQLEMNFVRERMMRRHYGYSSNVGFREGQHPESRKYQNLGGVWKCKGVMDWFGQTVANGYVVQRTLCKHLTETNYQERKTITERLRTCEDDIAPKFRDPQSVELCSLSMDLRQLPDRAFTKKIGPLGTYYRVEYDIAITFGAELKFELRFDGVVKGCVTAKYS